MTSGTCSTTWEATTQSNGAPPATDWNKRVDKSVFAPAFADWKWDWIDIPALIEGAATVYEFPLVDRDPLPRWTVGRVTLLGDAAHQTPPFVGQGLGAGVRDAGNLAWKLAAVLRTGAPDALLDSYQAEREPHARALIRVAQLLGRLMTRGGRGGDVVRRGVLAVVRRIPAVAALATYFAIRSAQRALHPSVPPQEHSTADTWTD